MSEQPRRAFVFTLKLGADTREELVRALDQISYQIAADQMTTGVSGGVGSGYTYELLHDPEQTHEKYFAELHAYLDSTRTPTTPRNVAEEVCVWTRCELERDRWHTGCGYSAWWADPSQFPVPCPHCGKPTEERKP